MRGLSSAVSHVGVLSDRHYRFWLLSQLLSASGTLTQTVAAAWLLLSLTGRPGLLGVLTAVSLGPTLLGGAWAGAVADRLPRRSTLILTQLGFIGTASGFLYLAVIRELDPTWILGLSGVTGLVAALDGPARQVYVLDIVGRAGVADAIKLYEVGLNVARVLGPATAAGLLASSGPAACFAFNSLSYLAPLGVLILFRSQWVGSLVRNQVADGSRDSVRAALVYLVRQRSIALVLVPVAASGVIFNPGVLYPLLASSAYHSGSGGYGALVTCFGLGALPGALLFPSRRGAPSLRSVRWRCALTAVTLLGLAVAPNQALGCIAATVTGFIGIGFIVEANTYVQLTAADEMRGRVMGFWTVALPGTSPVSGLLFGYLGGVVGARLTVVAVSITIILALASQRPWRDSPGKGDNPRTRPFQAGR